MAQFLRVSATRIINIDLIEGAFMRDNVLYVTYQGNDADVMYYSDEAQIIWEYMQSCCENVTHKPQVKRVYRGG